MVDVRNKYKWLASALALTLNVLVTGMPVSASELDVISVAEDVTVSESGNTEAAKMPIVKTNTNFVSSPCSSAVLGVLDISSMDIDDNYSVIYDDRYIEVIDDDTLFLRKAGTSNFYYKEKSTGRVVYTKIQAYTPSQVLSETVNVVDASEVLLPIKPPTSKVDFPGYYNTKWQSGKDSISVDFVDTEGKKGSSDNIAISSELSDYSIPVRTEDRVVGYVSKVSNASIENVPDSLTLQKKGTFQLRPDLKVTTAGDFTYTTSDKNVVAVNAKGKLTAKKVGTAIVTVKAGNYSKSVEVEVKSSALFMPYVDVDVYEGTPVSVKANKKSTYKSSNNKIATVDSNGKVTFISEGSVTITATSGNETTTCNVTCKKPSIDLGYSELVLTAGTGFALNYDIDSSTDKITFSSSNKNVATVNATGVIVAKKAGMTNIAAKTSGYSIQIPVTVKAFVDRYCSCYSNPEHVSTLTDVPATDITPAISYMTCDDCGRLVTSFGSVRDGGDPGHEHNYDLVIKDATCTEEGKVEKICKCGDVQLVNTLSRTEHSYGEPTIKDVITDDCASAIKVTSKECEVCGYVDSTEIQYEAAHHWGDWEVVQEPTEISAGSEKRTCTQCDVSDFEIMPKVRHEHVYTSVETAPTCSESGYITYTCNCGHSYTDLSDKPKSEHTMSEATVLTTSTCISKGTSVSNCVNCDYSETKELPLADHNPIVLDAVAATCAMEGKTSGQVCGVCEKVLVEPRTLSKPNHTWVTTPSIDASCGGTGVTSEVYCSECGTVSQKATLNECSNHSVDLRENDPICKDCGAYVAGVYDSKGRLIENWFSLTEGASSYEDSWFVQLLASHPRKNDIYSLVLPVDMTTIHRSFLRDDTVVDNIYLPAGLTSIGDYAFSGSKVQALRIPENVKSIGTHVAYNADNLTLVWFKNKLTSLGTSWFEDCLSLYRAALPNTVTSIGLNCFKNVGTEFEDFELPASVTSISYEAFLNTSGVKAPCTLVDAVKEAGAVKVIPIHDKDESGNCADCEVDKAFEIVLDCDNTYGILAMGGSSGLVIPETWTYEGEEYTCVGIDYEFFNVCAASGYNKVVLPLACKNIKRYSAHNLEDYTLQVAIRNPETNIEYSAFSSQVQLLLAQGITPPSDYWGAGSISPYYE